MNKRIIGILIVVFVAGAVGASVIFFNQGFEKTTIDQDFTVDEESLGIDETTDTLCKNLPFFDVEEYNSNYKNDLSLEVNNQEIYKTGRIGDIARFDNLIACGYFDGIDTHVIIEDTKKENSFKQISKNKVQIEGTGIDFYVKGFSPNGSFLIYIESGYAFDRVRIYDVKKDKVIDLDVNISISAELYGFTSDEKYFYACSDTDYHGIRYARIYNVPNFNVQYDLAEERQVKEEYESLYLIQCEYDKNRNVLVYNLTERYKEKDPERVIEYSFDDSRAVIVK
jgi:hypothetical protein